MTRATLLESPFAAGILNQNPPHRFRSGGKEIFATPPILSHWRFDQPDAGLMHQRGRLRELRISIHPLLTMERPHVGKLDLPKSAARQAETNKSRGQQFHAHPETRDIAECVTLLNA